MKPKFKIGDRILLKDKKYAHAEGIVKNVRGNIYAIIWGNEHEANRQTIDYIDAYFYKVINYNRFWTKFNES